ncbi:peroxiredoxin [bacterium]|nr:peroxiredoxin [bacterium]
MENKNKLIGNPAPEFQLLSANSKEHSLSEFHGKWIALYFYPKDNTSGCTKEAQAFSALKPEFEENGASIIGISPDSPQSHARFIEKQELSILLLSDPSHEVIEKYGAWQLKKNFGREYHGVVRSTLLIDANGVIAYHWLKVKVQGHAEAVLSKLKELKDK